MGLVRTVDIVEGGQPVREVVLDTETTGLSPEEGHRIVEIGCLELINHLPTGRKFHSYLNPDRDIPVEATAIHGLAHKDLLSQPRFAEQVELFLLFIGDDQLVIHNASFDLSFLNAELDRLSLSPIEPHRAVDTLVLARQKFPGSPASLDALCKRFSINNSISFNEEAIFPGICSQTLRRYFIAFCFSFEMEVFENMIPNWYNDLMWSGCFTTTF